MTLVDEAKLFVIDYFEAHSPNQLFFHSLAHTRNVVQQAGLIAQHENLNETETQIVLIAAWFHDTGYLTHPQKHEEASIALARSFLDKQNADSDFTETIVRCINITKRKKEPVDRLEKILLDADVAHLGYSDFISTSKKLKKEFSLHKDISALEYWETTLQFMEQQVFYTQYAQQNYVPEKEKNIQIVKSLINELKGDTKGKKKEQKPEKGIESMFRLTASNQMRLTSIADKKANILISINSVLGSVSAAVASKQPFLNGQITIPIIILFLSSILSLIFAILSCRPQLSSQKYSLQDVDERKMNLLFFGNFYQLTFPQYLQAMKEMMQSYDYLYSSMIKDQYYLGLSLYRKYKLLRIAYNIFMYGFITAASVFIFLHILL